MVRIVGLDVVAPLLVFYLAVGAGVSLVWSLVLSGCPPLVGVAVPRRTAAAWVSLVLASGSSATTKGAETLGLDMLGSPTPGDAALGVVLGH